VQPKQVRAALQLWPLRLQPRPLGLNRIWLGVEYFLERAAKNTLSILAVLTVALVAFLLWKALFLRALAIEAIAVPRQLAENGYTAEVAAQRLRDALNRFAYDADEARQGPTLLMPAEIVNIVVPSIGISLETIAASIRTFLHMDNRQTLSGELVVDKAQLRLRLRLSGKELVRDLQGPLENPDQLMEKAAPTVFENVDPYRVVQWWHKKDPEKSIERANEFIAKWPSSPFVQGAHLIIGTVHYRKERWNEPRRNLARYSK
jgi:hypothetical protein